MSERRKPKPPTYVPAPEVPAKMRERYEAVMRVLAGAMTVSEAARSLGMSRNHFQTLLHKSQGAMVDALEPKPGGRPPKPPEVSALETQVEKLSRENHRLKARVETIDRLLGVASDLVTGRVPLLRPKARTSASPRSRSPKTAAAPASSEGAPAPDEPDPQARAVARDAELKELGVPSRLRAAIIGAGASTLRRWRRGQTPCAAPAPQEGGAASTVDPPTVAPEKSGAAERLVRHLRGIIGAEALSKATGLSRRHAAAVKEQVLTKMEAERKQFASRVTVTEPGVVRGFDAMLTSRGFVFVHADAAIAYRTSLNYAERYDVEAVLLSIESDFRANGAPLVLRLDQAKQHKARPVYELLRRWGVQPLHGPPHHPQYYGQLERQNREHRAWLAGIPDEAVPAHLEWMRTALNDSLPRKRLGWRTAGAVWASRRREPINRDIFFAAVETGTARALNDNAELNEIEARRLAIHRALVEHGVLKLRAGRKC